LSTQHRICSAVRFAVATTAALGLALTMSGAVFVA
jgi:hypothetical protein